MMKTTASKVLNIATARNGRDYKRTTKVARFNFAVITIKPDGKGEAKFCETEAEANAFVSYLEKNRHTENSIVSGAFAKDAAHEVVPVIHFAN